MMQFAFTDNHEGMQPQQIKYDFLFEYLFSSPSGPGLVSWPQYDKQKQEYMELGLTQTVKQKLKKDRVHFATVDLPQKLQRLAAAAAKAGN